MFDDWINEFHILPFYIVSYLYYIREGGAMVSSFETPILPPLPFLNYKRNVKIKIGTQRKLPKINLQHSITNHLKEETL